MAVTEFVRNGGKYYGIGAGAFLALQKEPNRPRLSLVPFTNENEITKRGSTRTEVKLTKEGLSVFEARVPHAFEPKRAIERRPVAFVHLAGDEPLVPSEARKLVPRSGLLRLAGCGVVAI